MLPRACAVAPNSTRRASLSSTQHFRSMQVCLCRETIRSRFIGQTRDPHRCRFLVPPLEFISCSAERGTVSRHRLAADCLFGLVLSRNSGFANVHLSQTLDRGQILLPGLRGISVIPPDQDKKESQVTVGYYTRIQYDAYDVIPRCRCQARCARGTSSTSDCPPLTGICGNTQKKNDQLRRRGKIGETHAQEPQISDKLKFDHHYRQESHPSSIASSWLLETLATSKANICSENGTTNLDATVGYIFGGPGCGSERSLITGTSFRIRPDQVHDLVRYTNHMLGSVFRRAQLSQRWFQSTKETLSTVSRFCGHNVCRSVSIRGAYTSPNTAVNMCLRQSEQLMFKARALCNPRLFSTKSQEPSREQSRNEQKKQRQRQQNQQVAWYMGGLTLFTISFTYASVPLYRMFCQKTGFAGTVKKDDVKYEQRAKPVSGKRLLTIKFNSDVADALQWKFTPQQHEIKVVPGEAALAFYSATNNTDEPIIGVASYNVQPEQAGQYFNKIQCFCFEEQVRLTSTLGSRYPRRSRSPSAAVACA